jgi:hypothetical protein
MDEVLPSWATGEMRSAGGINHNPWYNPLLRNGEVVRVIYPEDPDSLLGKFIEYDVLVAHHENGTSASRIYHSCLLASDLGGLADKSVRTLRAAESGSPGSDVTAASHGTKVLILCLNADQSQAVIVGGIRDSADADTGRKARGHHFDWVFNGVKVTISDAGGFRVEKQGPTDREGELDTSRGSADAAGTAVEVDAAGSFSVTTGDGKESVVLDRPNGVVAVKAAGKVTVDAGEIDLNGDGQATMRATAFRNAHQQLHDGIKQGLQALQAAASGPLSGFKPGIIQMLLAYSVFETKASTFLSGSVKTG